MQLLYQLDLAPQDDIDAVLEAWQVEHNLVLSEYPKTLIHSVMAERDAIDAQLGDVLEGWTVDRLGAVERAIGRIAMCELLAGSVPAEVAVDEAVELAKRYASPEAAKLLNGALGTWLRNARATEGTSDE
jgi:N utilization substance protein B